MKIRIKKGARAAYVGYMVHFCKSPYNHTYAATIEALEGVWLEVETDYLFADQFNTAGLNDDLTILELIGNLKSRYDREVMAEEVKCMMKKGLRVPIVLVDKIEGDLREGRGRCNYCGAHTPVDVPCQGCQRIGYVESYEPWLKYQRSLWVEGGEE